MSKASIIVPVYNVEKYLRRCLDSIFRQSYQDFELLCINDASPDHSQLILDEYEARYAPKMRILRNEQNMGLGNTRQRGIEEATGEFLFFVDSDDYIAPDYLERFLADSEASAPDIVVAGYTRDIQGALKHKTMARTPLTLVTNPFTWGKMFRKSFLKNNDIEFITMRIGEDIHFTLACLCAGAKLRFIPYYGYHYFFNVRSITNTFKHDQNLEAAISAAFDSLSAQFPLAALPVETQHLLEYAYFAGMTNSLIVYGRGCGPQAMRRKHRFFLEDLKSKFPNYPRNPYIWQPFLKGPGPKCTLGVFVVAALMRLEASWALFNIISRIH